MQKVKVDYDVFAFVDQFFAKHPEHQVDHDEIRKFYQINLDMTHRSTLPAHFTVSAAVCRDDALLLINNIALDKWLLPGGHIDNSETIYTAVSRELNEETSLKESISEKGIIDIDLHSIPANARKNEPAHHHIDLRISVDVAQSCPIVNESEISAFKWVKFSDLPENYRRLARQLNV